MDSRDLLDEQFKKIYGRYPSTAERLQFKKNRPMKQAFSGDDLRTIRERTPLADSIWNERRKRESKRIAPQTDD